MISSIFVNITENILVRISTHKSLVHDIELASVAKIPRSSKSDAIIFDARRKFHTW